MSLSEKKAATNKEYLNKLDDIKIRVANGERAIIQEYATKNGISVNQLVVDLINESMKKDGYNKEIHSGVNKKK